MLGMAILLGMLGTVALVGAGGGSGGDDDDDRLPDADQDPDPQPDPGTDPIPDPGTDPTPDPGTDPTPGGGTDPLPPPGGGTDPVPPPGSGGGGGAVGPNVVRGVVDDGWETIFGTDGEDIIYGGDGQDYVIAFAGDDTVYLEGSYGGYSFDPWADTATTVGQFAGDDTAYGGDGFDDLRDPVGANALYGGGGGDFIDGVDIDPRTFQETGPVADRLDGGGDNDLIFADNGDTVTGGAGFDRFVVRDEAVLVPGTTSYDYLDEAVVITDFDPNTETLSIDLNWEGRVGTFAVEDLTQTVRGNDLVISLEGKDIAVLQGVTSPLTDPYRLNIEFR